MNRLVIVGNGFDICCGLNTSYHSFINHYVTECLKEGLKYEKPSHKGSFKHGLPFYNPKDDALLQMKFGSQAHNVDQILEYIKAEVKRKDPLNGSMTFYHLNAENSKGNAGTARLVVHYKSELFYNSINRLNWSNIEAEYFKLLVKIYDEGKDIHFVEKLNKELQFIRGKLIQYIKDEAKRHKLNKKAKEQIDFIKDKLIEPVSKDKIIEEARGKVKIGSIQDTLILNFNYTEICHPYLTQNEETYNVNIHGMKDNEEDIVFGYGDETDPRYKVLEQSGIDEYLRHMKSPYYLTNPDFQVLRDFISSNFYEITILGHSLGLSDRVLLKELFEHNNCISIRPFHRGSKEDFRKKSLSLTRHYDNKEEMRRKVVFDESAILNRESE